MLFYVSAIGTGLLLGFGLALARSWAVWYLANCEAEESQERARIFAAAVEQIRRQEAASIEVARSAVVMYIGDDPRWLRPAKAAKQIRALRNGTPIPVDLGRYCAWRATQTSRRYVQLDPVS